jgi:hypothetical protein
MAGKVSFGQGKSKRNTGSVTFGQGGNKKNSGGKSKSG